MEGQMFILNIPCGRVFYPPPTWKRDPKEPTQIRVKHKAKEKASKTFIFLNLLSFEFIAK